MRLRLTLLSAFVAVVCGVSAPAVAQTSGEAAATITRVDTSNAPNVTLTVAVEGALASQPLDPSAFTVVVSGEEEQAALVGLPTDPIEVQLVLDTSGSMRGAPIDAARAAASQLVDRLPASVSIGVLGFGDAPYTIIDATTDHDAVRGALAGVQVGGETAMYDAVVAVSQRFTAERRVVVLLTDGADTVSAATLDAASGALRATAGLVYVVALDTPETDLAAAQQLADSAGGHVELAADPSALGDVYASIAEQLSALYEVSFVARSTGSTGIVVRISADGISAEAETRVSVPVAAADEATTGTLPAVTADANARSERVGSPGLLERNWALPFAVVALFVALLLAALLLTSRPARPSQLAVTREIRRASRGGAVKNLTEHAMGVAEGYLERSGRRRGLEAALENGGISMRAGEAVVLVVTFAFGMFAVGLLAGGPILALVLAALVVGGSHLALTMRVERRRARFAEQLEQTLPLMAGGLRAGFGIMQALDSVAEDAEEPTAGEVRRVIAETRLGRDLGDALAAMADRVGSDDFHWVVEAIDIHRQVGGDLAEVLDKVAETIRDRNRIRRHIEALSGEGKLSALILFALPVGLFAYLSAVNPDYIKELTGRGVGVALLLGAGALMVVGGLWMRRIIRLVF